MFRSYRKHSILSGEWHFHPQCSRWPETDYVEEDFPYSEEFCLECVKLYSRRAPTPARPEARYLF